MNTSLSNTVTVTWVFYLTECLNDIGIIINIIHFTPRTWFHRVNTYRVGQKWQFLYALTRRKYCAIFGPPGRIQTSTRKGVFGRNCNLRDIATWRPLFNHKAVLIMYNVNCNTSATISVDSATRFLDRYRYFGKWWTFST